MKNETGSNVLVYIDNDGICRIKLVGEIRYSSSAKGFMDFVNTEVVDEKIKDVIVDLRECDYIDSTDIGVLAKIATLQQGKGEKKPMLIYSEESKIFSAVADVKINPLFDVRIGKSTDENSGEFHELKNPKTTKYEITKLMYSTHKILSDLDDENKEKFESVVKYLGESVSSMERKSGTFPKINKH
jgi:anti-anti-sigma factor